MCSASIFRVQTVSSVKFQQRWAASFLEGTQTVWGTEIASHQVCCVETRRVDGGWRSVTVCCAVWPESVWDLWSLLRQRRVSMWKHDFSGCFTMSQLPRPYSLLDTPLKLSNLCPKPVTHQSTWQRSADRGLIWRFVDHKVRWLLSR